MERVWTSDVVESKSTALGMARDGIASIRPMRGPRVESSHLQKNPTVRSVDDVK